MTEQRKDSLLKLASEQVKLGIYAVQKGRDYIELRNDHYASKTQLKKAKAALSRGRDKLKVYCNGL